MSDQTGTQHRIEAITSRARALSMSIRGGAQGTELRAILDELKSLALTGTVPSDHRILPIQPGDKPIYGVIPHPKLKRDYKGQRVRTTTEMTNAWGTIPAGSLALIAEQTPKGSTLVIDACSCCGLKARMSAIKPDDIVFVEAAA